ncbi:thiopeptide-type bacteriocin biosynthesis protein [Pedobacter cryoconitis]|uniref:Thiopeptide-type bacteriocin biosynthesis protein n=1 Tax=Pedobacter cryoconitis TaxID=188932 RepID=A0A7W8YYC0_9SPHI|nr:lantibiotic dehydratase [Pedobacter cryoconitis]MBB5624078.1 thiopeptide-type bacteriocin biosynthesis protein [Pedobacter cryoconitis]
MSIRDTYSFDQRLILRSPIYSLPAFDENFEIETLVNDSVFLEAIYIASPSLHNACIKYRNGLILIEKEIVKFKYSLYKYYSRMHNRCTPFGLFSSCRLTNWKKDISEVIIGHNDLKRHTRLDMHYLCELAAHISLIPTVSNKILYYPNSSWYRIGEEIRYVEYQYKDGKRQHQISAIKSSGYLLQIIEAAKFGLTKTDLISILENAGIENDNACKFIDNCFTSQLLINELDPAITGEGLFTQILITLEKYNTQDIQINNIVLKLRKIDQLLNELDLQNGNEVICYHEIIKIIDTLGVPCEAGKIFQTDVTGVTCKDSGLSINLQGEILTAIDILYKTSSRKKIYLETFAKHFHERYGDKEMSLLEVLDAEAGIGYGVDNHLIPSPILQGLTLPATSDSQLFTWGKWERILQKKWLQAYKLNAIQIEISDEDFDEIIPANIPLPSSLQIMFEVISSGQIYIKNAGGTSAVNMIARFAQSDSEISKLAFDLTKAEQDNAEGVILAEIIHLPDGRIGNILQRPAFREYEMPYLAKSLLPEDQQVQMQDLLISYRNKKLILYSKRLKKIIIPRLSNAHNFSVNPLPVYRFFCDLQDQDQTSNLEFNWGSLQKQYTFLPRVVYRNIILKRASWVFTENDISNLLKYDDALFKELLSVFVKEHNLPLKVVLADGDNELLIDFKDYKTTYNIFYYTLKGKKYFVFKEHLEQSKIVKDIEGRHYQHEFQSFVTIKSKSNMELLNRHDHHYRQEEIELTVDSKESEWVYYKIYCGVRNADFILSNPIKQLMSYCEQKGWIDEWFFIRYKDDNFHIRLRLKLTNVKWLPYITRVFHKELKPYRKMRFIWNVTTDTYQPEYVRYGANTLYLAEKLFYRDSIAFLGFLDHTSGDERENLRWQFAILSIDTLFEAFEFNIKGKLELMQKLKENFASEFTFGVVQRKQLSKLFRRHKEEIYASLSVQQPGGKLYQLYLILRERTEKITPLIQQLKIMEEEGALQVPIINLLDSYIHMLVNRIIPDLARLHEVVIYDFLYQYYISIDKRKIN